MGRRRTKNLELPQHMQLRSGTYYFVYRIDGAQKWMSLGRDFNEARRKWAELEIGEPHPDDRSFEVVVRRYRREIMPKKAYLTQKGNERELEHLLPVFGAMPIDQITPQHVRRYLDLRGKKAPTRANREKALLSHIFNFAREQGYTTVANPCAGVRGHKEAGRDRHVSDAEFNAVRDQADQTLRDAMDLALLTGQRPADVLKLMSADIQDGALRITQNKTGAKLEVEIVGELAELIARLAQRAEKNGRLYLVQTESGNRLTLSALRSRFDKARTAAGVSFQFRDIRAKTATDLDDREHAKKLLGHKQLTMTEHYIRARKGERVKPLRSEIKESGPK